MVHPERRRVRRRWMPGALLALTLVFMVMGQAIAGTGTSPPSEAEQAYQRGMLAASQKAYEIALDQLREAQAKMRKDPRILYALGATHVKAGHTLQGVLWLSAALRAAPDAENADALRSMTCGLHQDAFEELERLFAAAAGAATLLPAGESRSEKLTELLRAQAEAGDLEGATLTAKALQASADPSQPIDAPPNFPETYWDGVARYHAAVGHFPQAEAAIRHAANQGPLWVTLAHNRLMTGDRAGARAALAQAESSVQRMVTLDEAPDPEILDALVTLARGYAGNGQDEDYRRVLAQATAFAKDRELNEDDCRLLSETEVMGPNGFGQGRAAVADGVPELWIALAERWEQQETDPLNLPARLRVAKLQEDPGELALALIAIAQDYGQARLDLLSLDAHYPEAPRTPPPACPH